MNGTNFSRKFLRTRTHRPEAFCGLLALLLGLQPVISHAAENQPNDTDAATTLRLVEKTQPHYWLQVSVPERLNDSEDSERHSPPVGSSVMRIIGTKTITNDLVEASGKVNSKQLVAPIQLSVVPTENQILRKDLSKGIGEGLPQPESETASASLAIDSKKSMKKTPLAEKNSSKQTETIASEVLAALSDALTISQASPPAKASAPQTQTLAAAPRALPLPISANQAISASQTPIEVAPTEPAELVAKSNRQSVEQQPTETFLQPFSTLTAGLPSVSESSFPSLAMQLSSIPAYLTLYADEEGLYEDESGEEDFLPESTGSLTEKLSDNDGESLGRAPPERGLQFLRRQAILLPPGDYQFDIGVNYTLFEADLTTAPGGILTETNVRQRILTVPLEIRYGLTEKMQLSLYVPFGWVNTEVSSFGMDDFDNSGGIGDIRFALSRVMRRSRGCYSDPDIILTFGATAPTGDSDVVQALLGSPVGQLGGGFWAASWNLLFIHNYDPVTVFYSLGSRHRFSRTIDGIEVVPGDEYIYQLGVGFAVNSSVTLSSSFLGEYITEPELDGFRQAGLIREPMRMRFAATIANSCRDYLVEPFAEIGMTESAPSARIGITWTH